MKIRSIFLLASGLTTILLVSCMQQSLSDTPIVSTTDPFYSTELPRETYHAPTQTLMLSATITKPISQLEVDPLVLNQKASLVTFSPDGQFLATISAGEVIVINMESGMPIWSFIASPADRQRHGMNAGSLVVVYSPDGRLLAVGGLEAKIYLLDASTGKQIASQEHSDRIETLTFTSDGSLLIAGSCWDKPGITVWDINAQEITFFNYAGCVIESFPNQSKLLIGSFLPLWPSLGIMNLPSGDIEQELLPAGSRLYSVSIYPDGSIIAANVTESVRLWDISTASEIKLPWQGFQNAGSIRQVLFASNGLLAILDYEGGITFWDVVQKNIVANLTYKNTNFIAFSDDGSRLAIVDPKEKIRILDVSELHP
jgi:WD40 repeat protein